MPTPQRPNAVGAVVGASHGTRRTRAHTLAVQHPVDGARPSARTHAALNHKNMNNFFLFYRCCLHAQS